jgi:signal transduction histidine kinase
MCNFVQLLRGMLMSCKFQNNRSKKLPMKKILILKTSTSKNLWNKFINANRYENGVQNLVVDLTQCSFIEPFHIVQIACLIEEYHLQNVGINFVKSDALALNEYLTNIHFFDYWESGFSRSNYQQMGGMTNLSLWKLNETMIHLYATYAEEYFEKSFYPIDFEPLSIAIKELFNNIIDHSGSPVSGYTTIQFYPQNKRLKIAICDFGVGIPTLVNRFIVQNGQEEMSSMMAFKKAFENNFSTKSTPRNKGYGLDLLRAIVKNSNGQLRVISNDVMMNMTATDEQIFAIKHNFQGTVFEIILDTTTFDTQDERLSENEF